MEPDLGDPKTIEDTTQKKHHQQDTGGQTAPIKACSNCSGLLDSVKGSERSCVDSWVVQSAGAVCQAEELLRWPCSRRHCLCRDLWGFWNESTKHCIIIDFKVSRSLISRSVEGRIW